jgi:hypothetical protein
MADRAKTAEEQGEKRQAREREQVTCSAPDVSGPAASAVADCAKTAEGQGEKRQARERRTK